MIVVKAIRTSKLRQDVFRLEFLTGMREIERAIIKEFKTTTKTWVGDKPTFEALRGLSKGELTLLVGPSGNENGIKKWNWLNEGTKVRYATMSQDWVSKTVPNVVGSRAGRGKKLFVNTKFPRPGIEARNWDKLIEKKFKPIFKRRMEKAMKIATEKSGQFYRT